MGLLRILSSRGLDRSLAWTELLEPSRLHSFFVGVRHLRGSEPSYWWIDACFDKAPREIGLTTMPVGVQTRFAHPRDFESTWEWVLATTRARSLAPPNLDEQLWCRGGDESNCEAVLNAALTDAEQTLPGTLSGLHGYLWDDDRTSHHGLTLSADFTGRASADRPARALLHSGSDAPEVVAVAKAWSAAIAARCQVPLRWGL